MGKLTHKVALITGASSGIGAALGREFVRHGARVVLMGRRADRLQALASELCQQGGEALAVAGDVTQPSDLAKVVAAARERWKQIDFVIANAGFGVSGRVEQLNVADYQRQFDTNVFGVLNTFYATVDELKKTKGGFVIVGSVNGYIALPGNSAYAMSKFAVRALSDSLYHEMKPWKVAVTYIAPGFVESEIRKVDNKGILHEHAHDRVPQFIQMPAQRAARYILRAVKCRQRELVVTLHGKIVVWLARHFPWLVALLIRKTGLRARPEP